MRYMSEAEQEHFDHVAGSASEFQNCFSEAEMRRSQLNRKHAELIGPALDLGMFVVAEEVPYYCKATDACAGSYRSFRFAFHSRQQADDYARQLAAEDFDPECRLMVLPELPAEPYAPEPCDEEIPF